MRMIAEYTKKPLPNSNGNPLVEALPVCTNINELVVKLEHHIQPGDFWSEHAVFQQAILQDFANIHIPAPQFSAMYTKFMALLINRYSRSNPFSAQHAAPKYELAKAKTFVNGSWFQNVGESQRTTAPSLLIHGLSGTGKTTVIRAVLSCTPQVIVHKNYNGRAYRQDQLVWLSIDLPATASLKALALNFFLAVDNALGSTSYYEEWSKKGNASVDKHLNAVQKVASVHEVGLVHIDELQFMLKYAKSKDSPTLQVLEALFNKLGIPLILSSTSQGLELFEMPSSRSDVLLDITTTRRMLNDRDFKFDIHKENSAYFNRLFNAFFPASLQFEGVILDDGFKQKYHELSCGLPAIMSRLAHLYHETIVQLRYRSSKAIPAPIKLLEYVYSHQFKLIDPALRQLRQNNTKQYEQLIADGRQQKAAFSDKEKRSKMKKRENQVIAVKKGGMFDKHSTSAASTDPFFKAGFE